LAIYGVTELASFELILVAYRVAHRVACRVAHRVAYRVASAAKPGSLKCQFKGVGKGI